MTNGAAQPEKIAINVIFTSCTDTPSFVCVRSPNTGMDRAAVAPHHSRNASTLPSLSRRIRNSSAG